MKAIIIDDEPLARLMVKEYLQGYPHIEVVEECDNGFEGLKAIPPERHFNLLITLLYLYNE